MAITPGSLAIDEPATIDKRADTNAHTRSATLVQREVVSVGSADDTQSERFLGIDASGNAQVVAAASTNAIGRLTGTFSAANSTTAPLGISGVFTGVFEEVKDYGSISLIVFSDVASAADGLAFQWSPDGTNADVVTSSSVTASAGRSFALTPRARYFRVVYTNGGTAQAVFRLTTTYHPAGSGLISRPLDQALNDENYAQTVRAIVDGQDPSTTDMEHVASMTTAPAGTERGLVVRQSGALPTGTNNIGDVDVLTVPAPLNVSGGGTEAAAQRVTIANDSTGVVSVDDNGGTLTVDAPVGTPIAVRQSDGAGFFDQRLIQGNVAHDGVDSGSPVKVGARAQSAQITAVADGDRADTISDRHGNLRTRTGHEGPAGSLVSSISVPAANTQATATRAAGAAGVRNVCTALTVVLAAGTTAPAAVNLQVNLIDGATGGVTYLWRATISLPATAGAMNGVALSGLWFPGAAATAMTLEFSAAGGANTIESVSMQTIQITE